MATAERKREEGRKVRKTEENLWGRGMATTATIWTIPRTRSRRFMTRSKNMIWDGRENKMWDTRGRGQHRGDDRYGSGVGGRTEGYGGKRILISNG